MSILSADTVSQTHKQTQQTSNTQKNSNSSFADTLNQSNEKQEQIQKEENTKSLLNDLLSMIKTGLTVSEMEMLQELLAKLNKLKNEDSDNESDQELKAMLSALEAAVLAIKKRLSGEAVLNQEVKDKEFMKNGSIDSRIEAVSETINEIISGSIKEDKLIEELTNDVNPNFLQRLDSNKFKLDKSEYTTDEEFNYLVKKLNLEDMNKEDMSLFKSIIEDRFISNDEIKDLSYEQMETLGKFVFVEEGPNGYVEESLINADYKAGTLLSIPVITNDKNFNKAVFDIVAKMDNNRDIELFLSPLTGTSKSNKLIAFPDLQSKHYNGQDMGKVLNDLISDYQTSFDNSKTSDEREYYHNQKNQFIDLLNLYNEFSQNGEESIENEKYLLDIQFDLVEDLLSMMKTGFTVSELEALEKLVSEINKLIEDSKDDKVSKEKIEDMIKTLEAEIQKLEDRLNIKTTTEEDTTEERENLTSLMKEFKSIVRSLEDSLNQIKEESTKLLTIVNTDDELKLREALKNKY